MQLKILVTLSISLMLSSNLFAKNHINKEDQGDFNDFINIIADDKNDYPTAKSLEEKPIKDLVTDIITEENEMLFKKEAVKKSESHKIYKVITPPPKQQESIKIQESLDEILIDNVEPIADYDSKNFNKLIAKTNTKSLRKPIIVIDAGHGGKDPGALSFGIKEKHITLKYARELSKALNKTGKYKVRMTRSRDIFVPLVKRNEFARKANADLFISIHADYNHNRATRGFGVYTLSEKASDIESAKLAAKENRADIIAGVNLSKVNKEASNILIDLSLRRGKNQSIKFAKSLVQQYNGSVKTRKNTHRYAGFAVLKNPDMASILLEVGFLSNKHDMILMRKPYYRKRIVKGMVKAIDNYFR